jgi:hypothetical protein
VTVRGDQDLAELRREAVRRRRLGREARERGIRTRDLPVPNRTFIAIAPNLALMNFP